MYKNQLQEFAQQSCINLPSYSCIREGPDHAPRFKAKVNCNGEIFESPKFCCTLRQAEHAAAEVALRMLSRRGPSRALAAKVLDETGVYKNLLQETAHRAGLKLPVYTTVRAGPGYAPVFTCTVEIAGMSFSGEPGKTKKQAQKSAAMTAWFALKEVAQEYCSSLSFSDLGGKDEQEQVIVARYLSSIKLPETRKSEQREKCKSQKELFVVEGDVIPYGAGRPAYPVKDLTSTYSYITPDWVMYETFRQGIPMQQSHFLSLPSASTSIPRPRLFPFIQSIFRPDIGSFLWAREREPVAIVPEIGPFFYLSNNLMPLPYRSDSRVTIEEIEENSPVREEWPNKDVKPPRWRDNVLSSVSTLDVSDNPQHCGSSSSFGLQLLPQESGDVKGLATNDRMKSVQIVPQNKEFSWLPPGFICNRPNAGGALEGRLQSPNIDSSRSWSDVGHLQSNVARHSRDLVRFPTVSHGAGQNAVPFVSSGFQPEIPNRFAPVSTPRRNAAATRPSLEGMKHLRPMSCAGQMAPAVQIRSVVPVRSSPVRSMPSSSQERRTTPSQLEMQRAEAATGKDMSAASSEFCRLQI